jgi:hypothetical protein
VGRPLIDMLRRADLPCSILPVNITGGFVEHRDDGYYYVPKRDLIVGLQVLLQQGRLNIEADRGGRGFRRRKSWRGDHHAAAISARDLLATRGTRNRTI